MHFTIDRTPGFVRKLEQIRKAGGNSAAVASHAESVIQRLIQEGSPRIEASGRLTRYGEKRMRQCFKFDLRHSYRMACMKHESRLVLFFIGAHDEWGRWARKNSGRDWFPTMESIEVFPSTEDDPGAVSPDAAYPDEKEYEEVLMEQVDDRVLRNIFGGLCGSAS